MLADYKDCYIMAERTIKQVQTALDRLPKQLRKDLAEGAGKEAIAEILGTTGIQKYPPTGSGNAPPYPYYKRGTGTQYSASSNAKNSEKYGKRWQKPVVQGYKTTATNTASYGQYLVSDANQASHMGKIGWRRIFDVIKEKAEKIRTIYGKWVMRTIKKVGL